MCSVTEPGDTHRHLHFSPCHPPACARMKPHSLCDSVSLICHREVRSPWSSGSSTHTPGTAPKSDQHTALPAVQGGRSAFILNCNRGSWAHSMWPHKDVLADVHSSTVPDSPNAQITQMFTLVKGHTSGTMTNLCYGWASPKPLMGKEADTRDVHSLMPFTRNVSERRTCETEQIGGFRGCSGNGVNHKRA